MSASPGLKPRYGFVVLNYNNYTDTIACVESILRITDRDDYCIVIVDNSSPNDSFEKLKSKFEGHPKITLAFNDQNNGYSAGNNTGIRILRENGISQVIIATNDTEIISHNILDEFDKLDLSDVGIVGTDVLTPGGVHQNPPLYRLNFLYFLNLYLYEFMVGIRTQLYRKFPAIEHSRRSSVATKLEESSSNSGSGQQSVYMLHGCFLYLTKQYLDKVGLLDESFFMYGEEDIMAWNCELNGLKRLYLPNIKILHKDGRSTEDAHKSNKEKFIRTMTIKSKRNLIKNINKWKMSKLIIRDFLNDV